jgi:hypothetical protein
MMLFSRRSASLVVAATLSMVACASDEPAESVGETPTSDGPVSTAPNPTSPSPPEPTADSVPDVGLAAPTTPPAQVCGNDALLAGPSEPPPAAIVVEPGDDVSDISDAAPAGSTFWFAPGTHSLASGQYNSINPADGATYIGAPGAVLDGGGIAAYAFIGTSDDVTISHLTVQNFVAPNNEGVVNHDSGDGWIVEYTTIRDNAGAGLMMGSDNVYRHNCLLDNGQYGINAFRCRSYDDFPSTCGGPIRNAVVEGNEIAGNNQDDWETVQPGCGCTGGVKFWDVDGAVVRDNWIRENLSVGLWADNNNRGFLVENNYISDNRSEALWFEAGYDAIIRNNTIVRNTWGKGAEFDERGDSFPIGTIYISEAGSDSTLDLASPTFLITGNNFVDNWGGVVLWENSDRFCSSPAHTHLAYCTLHFGDGYDPEPCDEANIGKLDDVYLCRWPTENVEVSDNVFSIDKDVVGCAGSDRCGLSAIVANFGTFPDWSPFKGEVIQRSITFDQNNKFLDNTYEGDWQFSALEPGNVLDWDEWTDAPFSQDAGSTFSAG